MSDDRATIGSDPDMRAAELALGVLEGEERAEALRRAIADPVFARDIERWRDYFGQLFAFWPEAIAPAGLWGRIAAAIDRQDRIVVTRPGAWRPAAIFATLAAAALAAFLVLRPPVLIQVPVPAPAPAPSAALNAPVLVTQLAATPDAKGNPAAVSALYDPIAGAIHVANAAYAPSGKSAELWIIPAGGVPYALGLLHAAGATRIPVGPHDRARMADGATLAVSIEPEGGSPKPVPTGPVVATGTLGSV